MNLKLSVTSKFAQNEINNYHKETALRHPLGQIVADISMAQLEQNLFPLI